MTRPTSRVQGIVVSCAERAIGLKAPVMRALALDVGSKTIGLAVSDPHGVIATAWEVLARKGHGPDAAAVAQRVIARDVEHIVVGLPLELNGREGRRAKLVRQFIAVLEPVLAALPERNIGLETWDERFSTAAAERTLIEGDVRRAQRKRMIDALAAQHILQGWLDSRPREVS